jgi:hypothetical protein
MKEIAAVGSGKHRSEETRRKISESLKGEKNPFFGRHHSEEIRRKISEAGKGRHPSEESRRKMSESQKGENNHNFGKPPSKETRRKLSDALKGRSFTEETLRKMSEANKGEKGSGWKGGISFEPYCPKFNREFKERVRAFFGYQCPECGMSEKENGKKLHVHHVTYNKKVCCDGTVPLFVPLCHSCHSKTNYNRVFWEYWFTEMITTKYGGKCYIENLVKTGMCPKGLTEG